MTTRRPNCLIKLRQQQVVETVATSVRNLLTTLPQTPWLHLTVLLLREERGWGGEERKGEGRCYEPAIENS